MADRRYVVSSAHPAHGGWQAFEEPALLAAAAGSGRASRDPISRKSPRAWSARFPRESRFISRSTPCSPAGGTIPPDLKIGLPPLAVYSPIHYQELPELFMEFISSLTGKSPSTTGFGSEGALTKGPFNALVAGGGSEQRAGVRNSDRIRGIHHFGRLRGPAHSRGSRRQPAGPGDLVPHARRRARSAVSDRARVS